MASYSEKHPLFGKSVGFYIFDSPEKASMDAIAKAYEEGLRLQKIFNIFDDSSEISELNRNLSLKVSDEFRDVLSKALKASEINPEYDVTKGKQFLARKNRQPEICPRCSFRDISIIGNDVILNNNDIMIDLGSIAKGYIVDRMSDVLKSRGIRSAIVDGRGDIDVFGKRMVIGIQHPRYPERLICSVSLENKAIATSGDYNQFYGSFDNSHIVSSKDVISVSVVADDLATADMFATLIFVSDGETREKLLSEYKDIKTMVIDNTLGITYYNGFEELIIDEE